MPSSVGSAMPGQNSSVHYTSTLLSRCLPTHSKSSAARGPEASAMTLTRSSVLANTSRFVEVIVFKASGGDSGAKASGQNVDVDRPSVVGLLA